MTLAKLQPFLRWFLLCFVGGLGGGFLALRLVQGMGGEPGAVHGLPVLLATAGAVALLFQAVTLPIDHRWVRLLWWAGGVGGIYLAGLEVGPAGGLIVPLLQGLVLLCAGVPALAVVGWAALHGLAISVGQQVLLTAVRLALLREMDLGPAEWSWLPWFVVGGVAFAVLEALALVYLAGVRTVRLDAEPHLADGGGNQAHGGFRTRGLG